MVVGSSAARFAFASTAAGSQFELCGVAASSCTSRTCRPAARPCASASACRAPSATAWPARASTPCRGALRYTVSGPFGVRSLVASWPPPQPASRMAASTIGRAAAAMYVPGLMRIGILTGGGDCPGLNAVIRAIVRKGIDGYGHAILGFRDGWRGPLENECHELTMESIRGILPRGGTILGSSRTNPFKREDGIEHIRATISARRLDGLIAIGGEDTLGAAARLAAAGVPVLGVPKTIDNDIGATDQTFGFDTAIQVACDAIDRLHTTAESHHRNLVVEVMGRHAGWIALHSGMAGGAGAILVPARAVHIEGGRRGVARPPPR